MYIQYLREMVPPPSQNSVGVCKQITLLILYYISSRLVNLLKVIDAPILGRNIFYLTVSFSFLNFSSQLADISGTKGGILFVPEMSASFMSDIV